MFLNLKLNSSYCEIETEVINNHQDLITLENKTNCDIINEIEKEKQKGIKTTNIIMITYFIVNSFIVFSVNINFKNLFLFLLVTFFIGSSTMYYIISTEKEVERIKKLKNSCL